jgi:hypothetical protein
MLERGRAVRTWIVLFAFALGAVWYGGKGIYVEGRKFIRPTPTFNPWESGYLLGFWVAALFGGVILLAWIIRSLIKAADEEKAQG